MQRDFYKAEAEDAVCQSLSDTVGCSTYIPYLAPQDNAHSL